MEVKRRSALDARDGSCYSSCSVASRMTTCRVSRAEVTLQEVHDAQRMLVELQVRSNLGGEGGQRDHNSRSASPAPSQLSHSAPVAESG